MRVGHKRLESRVLINFYQLALYLNMTQPAPVADEADEDQPDAAESSGPSKPKPKPKEPVNPGNPSKPKKNSITLDDQPAAGKYL